jgi:hypothetical protein
VFDDYVTLQNVLENCYKINPKLLDALAYGSPYSKKNLEDQDKMGSFINKELVIGEKKARGQEEFLILPITKAVKRDNNRCINILLEYMSYIEHDFSDNIQDIFCDLIVKK